MPRLDWRTFVKGWWAQGARDAAPQGTLRRATGIAPIKTTALRSRWGVSRLVGFAEHVSAHSVFRFAGIRYAGTGSTLIRTDTSASVKTGLDGTRLTMAKMPPTLGAADCAFVAGGGSLFKVNAAGVASQWGITPPPDGFTAAVAAVSSKAIDVLDSAVSWTALNATLADEGTVKQQGTNSMKMTVAAEAIGYAAKAIAIDLTTFGGGVASPDEDFIEVWVRIDNPDNLAQLGIEFDVGAGTFAVQEYAVAIMVSGTPVQQLTLAQQVSGVSDTAGGGDGAGVGAGGDAGSSGSAGGDP